MNHEKVSASPHFPAKLLLFGEYSILQGGDALALPLFNFTGQLNFQKGSAGSEQLHLNLKQKIVQHLSETQDEFVREIYTIFLNDLNRGLRFTTNVPTGYGLGSSGILSAALYNRYAHQKSSDISELRTKLASIERIFHGSSSGLDPLVSFLSKGVYVNQGEAQIIEPNAGSTILEADRFFRAFLFDSSFFLIDTGQSRSTAQMVAIFRQLFQNPAYSAKFTTEYMLFQNQAIEHVLQRNLKAVFNALKSVSQWQFEHMQPMIPESLRPHWKVLSNSETVSLKLLGAGGGGFLLGMRTKNANTTKHPFFTDLMAWEQKNAINKKQYNDLLQQKKYPLIWL